VNPTDLRSVLRNETKNQHFVSQVEQRLNATNSAAEPANQRILVFACGFPMVREYVSRTETGALCAIEWSWS
jgi:hypothetical protein